MPESHPPDGFPRSTPPNPRLTRRQLSVVRELAQGYDIAAVAEHRGCGLSSTYEIIVRICERLGLAEWQEIGPWAVEHGLADSNGHESSDDPSGFR